MFVCPRCHSKYPPGVGQCPQDGSALAPVPGYAPVAPTEELDSAAVSAPGAGAAGTAAPPRRASAAAETRADSPRARARPHTRRPGDVGGAGDDATGRYTSPLADGSSPAEAHPRRRRAAGSTQPHESVGRVLGNYRLLELIGRGGMGWVYRAEHIKLGREVALKVLKPQYAERRDSVARFFQEARAVNKIRHRNIVDVTDFVELDDGSVFIIMELLRGQPLSELMRAPGALTVPRALALLAQIADGLGAAHRVGIVHRDMKPDNVFVVTSPDGADLVKLLDFGVAKLIAHDVDVGWETKVGAVVGTPAYMSPEQAGGLQVDGRADIYAVGAIMYELFCGEPMFRARSFGEYVRLHLNERPTPPRQTAGGAGIDPNLERVILRCIEKSPDARYPTMEDLRADLLALLGAIETGAPVFALPAAGVAPPHALPPATGSGAGVARAAAEVTAPTRRPGRRPTRAVGFAAGAVALGAAAGLAFYLAASGDRAPAMPAVPAQSAAVPVESRPVATPLPLTSPAAPAPPALVTIRITSSPPGADVIAARDGVRRCRTPCDVAIDPGDGGSLVDREFIVRRRGYAPQTVRVPLASPPSARHVELRPLDAEPVPRADAGASRHPAASAAPRPDAAPPRLPPKPATIDPEDTLNPFEAR